MDRATFEKEFAAWSAQNMENYKFIYDYFSAGGPLGPVSIIIAENEDPVVENLEYSSLENYPANMIKSMSGIFDFIRETFDRIEDIKNGAYNTKDMTVSSVSLRIKYNAQYHYPEEVTYVVSYKQEVMGNPHYDLKITEFILN